tara:strand:- start:23977 stop:24846 length:870 start_codon:yes stop_codon:yes gene_type:complete
MAVAAGREHTIAGVKKTTIEHILNIYVLANFKIVNMNYIEDDDTTFTQLVAKNTHDNMGAVDESSHNMTSTDSINFLTKKFGSVSSFYNFKGETKGEDVSSIDGFARIKKLRSALAALDKGGWERSYHQRCFHEQFLNSVVKVLFKTDQPGHFERSYPRLLELNNWESIRQEILISTPRRFGKTISVCLFVSALLYSCPNLEVSIYSTCKRISCKLLRNCTRFLQIICDILRVPSLTYIKQTSDEVEIQGTESKRDTRRLNSYPSKVQFPHIYFDLIQTPRATQFACPL